MNAKDGSHAAVFGGIVLAALGMLMAACTFPSTRCRPDELVAPSLTSPAFDEVLDTLTPILTWSYEGDCEPDNFRISLSSSLEWPAATTGEIGGDTTWWTVPTALEHGMSYSWSVSALSGSTESPNIPGYFRIGPLCTSPDPADYAAPVLMSPPDGEPVGLAHIIFSDGRREPTVTFHFVWDNPNGCITPEGYHVEVSTSRSFRSSTIVAEWTTTHNRAMFFFPPGVEWLQCAHYYWRVTTILPDSSSGPTSEIRSFITPNTSGLACLEPFIPPMEGVLLRTGTSAIGGYVWHDECAIPDTPDVVPAGCVLMPDGGLEANGVFDPEETGISGVTVHLGSGPCPVVGGRTDVTAGNGQYTFSLLPAGTYCIAIDAMDEDNVGILIPGNWTSPYRWYGPGPIETEVTVVEGDIRRLDSFGWDYQFLPSPTGGIPWIPLIATPMEMINCRFGPGTMYEVRTSIGPGMGLPVVGRNQGSTWLAVHAPDLIDHCWVWGENVELEGDPEAAPILAAPPLSSPTPVQGCWTYNAQQQLVCSVPCPPNPQPGGACTP